VTAATARVERLTESDWRVFAGVRLRALTDSLGENDPQYQQEASFTAAQWRRRLRDHAQFAVLIGNRTVGLIGAQLENPETVYLYSLWLDPTARGQGLARPLVAAGPRSPGAHRHAAGGRRQCGGPRCVRKPGIHSDGDRNRGPPKRSRDDAQCWLMSGR
jgi:GNAT superfamily N-acetyltransferase